jgi:hypothetical protein
MDDFDDISCEEFYNDDNDFRSVEDAVFHIILSINSIYLNEGLDVFFE